MSEMITSESIAVPGVDPLDNWRIRDFFTALVREHHVILEQLDELSEDGWVQVRVHANAGEHGKIQSVRDAIRTLEQNHESSIASDEGPVDPWQLHNIDNHAALTQAYLTARATEAGPDAPSVLAPALTIAQVDQADAFAAALGIAAEDVEPPLARFVPDAAPTRHPRWSCEGCPDCVPDVPLGTSLEEHEGGTQP